MEAMTQFHPSDGRAIERIEVPQSLVYNWEYASPRARLTRLYENAKRDQWNATERLDWSIDVDPQRGLLPDAAIGIYGSEILASLSKRPIRRLGPQGVSWQRFQFLH